MGDRAVLLGLAAQVLAVVALSIDRLQSLKSIEDPDVTSLDREAFAYTLCVLVNTLFVLYYVLHGTLRERVVEIGAFVLASVLLSAYLAYIYWVGHFTDAVSLARLIVGLAFQPFNVAAGVRVGVAAPHACGVVGGLRPHR